MDKLHLLTPKERLPYFEKAAEQLEPYADLGL